MMPTYKSGESVNPRDVIRHVKTRNYYFVSMSHYNWSTQNMSVLKIAGADGSHDRGKRYVHGKPENFERVCTYDEWRERRHSDQ